MACLASNSKVLLDSTLCRATAGARTVGFAVASSSRGIRYASTSSSSSLSTTTANSSNIASLTPTQLSLLQPPTPLPRTHSVHVASLHFAAYSPQPLTTACLFAQRSAHSLGIPISNPSPLPSSKSLYTVIKGPFVHKKSQENFERRTHRRLIKIWDTNLDVLDVYLRYLAANGVGGVRIKCTIMEYVELEKGGAGEKLEGKTVMGKVMEAVEAVKRDLKADERAQDSTTQS